MGLKVSKQTKEEAEAAVLARAAQRRLETDVLVRSGYLPFQLKTAKESLQVWARSARVVEKRLGPGEVKRIKMEPAGNRPFRASLYRIVVSDEGEQPTDMQVFDRAHRAQKEEE